MNERTSKRTNERINELMTDSMELDLQRVSFLQEVGGASWWIQLWTITWLYGFLKELRTFWWPLNCDYTQLGCVKQLLQQQSVCCNLTRINFHLTPHPHVTSGIMYNSLWHQHSVVMRLLFHFLMTSSVTEKTRSDIREKPEMSVMELIVRPEQYDIIIRLSKSLSTIYIA